MSLSRLQAGRAVEYDIDAFSDKFKRAFVSHVTEQFPLELLAHVVYRELVPWDRQMQRVAETCWGTLGCFCAYLRQSGELRAWKSERGWKVQFMQGQFFDEIESIESEEAIRQEGPPPRPQRTKCNAVCLQDSRACAKRQRIEEGMRSAVAPAATKFAEI